MDSHYYFYNFINGNFGRNLWLLFGAIGAVEWLTMARIVRGRYRLKIKNL